MKKEEIGLILGVPVTYVPGLQFSSDDESDYAYLTVTLVKKSVADAVLAAHPDVQILADFRDPVINPDEEHVRVLRVIEYTGPRALVEDQIKRSVHGTKIGQIALRRGPLFDSPCLITAVTLTEYPEVIDRTKQTPPVPIWEAAPNQPEDDYKQSLDPEGPRPVTVSDTFISSQVAEDDIPL